ncbi:hypothetical protein ACGFK1_13145 [Mycobacterium sp. NPDC048908]|uniref:hypothetical protein n=1 Tax=Mycobacterium sp. NPDC048908 TaxID=3364292 RepID=UPI0037110ACA
MSKLLTRNWFPIWAIASTIAVVLVMVLIVSNRAAPGISAPERVPIESAAGTLPVGSPLPSDQHCAAYAQQVGSNRESRPENTAANNSVPSGLALPPWPEFWDPLANQLFVPRINGQFTGTTDQIIAWGACKWGFSTDVVRAVAWAESSWRQAHVGDEVNDPSLCVGGYRVPCPTSFGLLQLKYIFRPGSWPDSQLHTAFNVDYGLAYIRGCFEGWASYLRKDGYIPGDLPGCLGWHYSGEWRDGPALDYIQRVQRPLDERPWTRL